MNTRDNVRLGDYLQGGLTVAQLIERLKDLDQDAQVVFSYNYGDHWRTTVACRVDSAEESIVHWSEYHSMPKIVDDSRDEDEAGPTGFPVVVIS